MEIKELEIFGDLTSKPLKENVASLKKIVELKKDIEKLLKRNEECK